MAEFKPYKVFKSEDAYMQEYVKAKLEELKTSQWEDYYNCKDSWHELVFHTAHHEVINAIDTVLELLEKEKELEDWAYNFLREKEINNDS